ncbi:MAG: EAL domain-containing protein, partial [Phoenicibacter congonensis]|nr:EAL domain-containing protein [Phoenicibacter congonensis]
SEHLSIPNISVKWGICMDDGNNRFIEQMCDNAIAAVHSIKGRYDTYLCLFDTELKERLTQEQAIVDELDEALEQGQFEVYLQPKVRKGAQRWTDAEALVRWNHSQKGLISPGIFIPVLEKTRLIQKLDWFIWEETCRLLRRWEDRGFGKLDVSVNVSRVDIYENDFEEKIVALVERYGIHPSQLHLEITETACIENIEWVCEVGANLRKRGFVLEMDDFGSGYSSLKMLTQIPVDILKLDQVLIQNESKKPGSLRFIIGLAHWMKLKVVAEGVETKEQFDHMFEMGCDFVQGYYTAKPMHWRDFENNLQNKEIGGGFYES